MVSPTLAEKLERGETLSVGWPWRFMLFSLLVAVTTAAAYLGLAFGYAPFLETRLAVQQEALDELGRVVPQKQQEAFVRFYSQVANLQILLRNHVMIARIFPFLETNTNAAVFYTDLDLRVPERKLVLAGIASSYGVFAQQLQAFTVAPEAEQLIVNDSSARDGRVAFRITLTLKETMF